MAYPYIKFRVQKSKTVMTEEFVERMSLAVWGFGAVTVVVVVPRNAKSSKAQHKAETRRREGKTRSMALDSERRANKMKQ
jgi:hypothetical protein